MPGNTAIVEGKGIIGFEAQRGRVALDRPLVLLLNTKN